MERTPLTVQVDGNGHLVLPSEVTDRLGLLPGSRVVLQQERDGVRISRSTALLEKLYVEPTTSCNLACRTCMRGGWEGETAGGAPGAGHMTSATFARIMEGVRALPRAPALFFGGYGEPLLHPEILPMIAQGKAVGSSVELITNGTLLTEEICQRLIELRLDRLWISLDGTTEEEFRSVRRGGELGRVTGNAGRLFAARERALSDLPRVGISFVALRDTVASVPSVLRLGRRLGADRFVVSNVLAHTPELHEQSLYEHSFYETELSGSEWTPLVELPRMEPRGAAEAPLAEVLKGLFAVRIAGQDLHLGSSRCPFVEKGSMSVRWDGAASPCLPLLHTHTSLAFDFPPCTHCNSCEQADSNQSDCFGNPLPVCGGCLWAQGFIQCP